MAEETQSTQASLPSTGAGDEPVTKVEQTGAPAEATEATSADADNDGNNGEDTGEENADSVEAVEDISEAISDEDLQALIAASKASEIRTSASQKKAPESSQYTLRATLPANLLTTCVSAGWIATLVYYGAASKSLPWCITLGAVAPWALAATKRKSDGRLAKSFSTTYLTISLIAFAWFFAHGFKLPPPVVVQKQFIDIELTSFADFKDTDSPLPSSEEKDSVRKRSGSTDKVQTAPPVVQAQTKPELRTAHKTEEAGKRSIQPMAPQKVASAPTEMVLKGRPIEAMPTARNAEIPVQQKKLETKAKAISEYKMPTGWKVFQADQTMARQKNTSPGMASQKASSSQSMFMEEASPVELFEVVDNEGDTGIEVFQSGGRTSGGKGAPSTLQDYLKVLHKRIKRAWIPPNGDPRIATILFRINKTGKLVQVKLVRSTGDSDCDEAALSAVTACAPFKSLPSNFESDSLDVKYTFNYKVDSLSELPGKETR